MVKIFFSLLLLCIVNLHLFSQSGPTAEEFLSPNEIKWLNKHKNTLRFAPNPSWMPLDYINSKGVHKGFVADYLGIIEEKLGIELQMVYFDNWSDMLEGVKNNEVDLIGAIQKTDERAHLMNFTDAYQTIPLVILTRNDHPSSFKDRQIEKMKLAGVRGYASIEWVKQDYPGVEIVETSDDLTAILKTSLGETDGTIIDLMAASYIVEKYGINNLRLGTTINHVWVLSMGCCKQKPELCSIINKTLNSISEDEKRAIYTKWVNMNNLELPSFYVSHHRLIVIITYALLALVVTFVLFSFLLRRKVKLKTRDLVKSNAEILEAKKQIQKSEKHFRQLIENLTEIISKVDRDGNITYVSPSFCRLFGKKEEELIGNKFYSFIHEEDLESTFNKLDILKKPPHLVRVEHRLITANGVRWFEWTNSPIFDDDNNMVGIVGAGRDVTEKKKNEIVLEKALKEAEHNEALKTAFLENMSHEIRTPMNSILGFIDLIKDNNLSSDIRFNFLEQIEKSSNDLLNIISNIVDLSKIETGQAVKSTAPLNIHAFFHRLYNNAKEFITQNQNIKLLLESENLSEIIVINTDETKLHQIVCNIMHNAIKFTSNGHVKLSYNINANNQLEFTIEDSGIGIPQSDRELVFKRFTQGSKSKGALQPGLGIGLSIAKAYTKLLNGTISFESEVGKGTTFKVCIPVA
ncbi:MAG: transporter substrate-binding domain-containing protein [Prolixibacteraceae bacterium]|nr:transporter substrate-binding domain-containing protein [Prolixibacteraceae bacterium]